MHRIDEDGHVDNQFSEGDASTGQPATRVGADWLNAIQEELANAIEAAGVPLDKGNNAQLAEILGGVLGVVARIAHWGLEGISVHGINSTIADGAAAGIFSNSLAAGIYASGGTDLTQERREGVRGVGGSEAPGVIGLGGQDGDGVVGEAGENVSGTTYGVRGKGGNGVLGVGSGSTGGGSGVTGLGKDNRDGVWGRADGTGIGVVAESGGTGAPFRIVPGSQPAAVKGAMYLSASSNQLFFYDGSTWVALG